MVGTAARNTGYPGVEIHGKTIRVYFMYKRDRYGHTLGIEPTRNNIKHDALLPGDIQMPRALYRRSIIISRRSPASCTGVRSRTPSSEGRQTCRCRLIVTSTVPIVCACFCRRRLRPARRLSTIRAPGIPSGPT